MPDERDISQERLDSIKRLYDELTVSSTGQDGVEPEDRSEALVFHILNETQMDGIFGMKGCKGVIRGRKGRPIAPKVKPSYESILLGAQKIFHNNSAGSLSFAFNDREGIYSYEYDPRDVGHAQAASVPQDATMATG